ncbi:MAG TPA: hypothetical protein P5234_08065 [Thermoanaerobaculaceae bacterium]|nr:hypothetical protein [Thermoanaerobaculaceae bacterium]HRS16193.1 hypothetical protein [Thermoanaerobaculaceae bacterium]
MPRVLRLFELHHRHAAGRPGVGDRLEPHPLVGRHDGQPERTERRLPLAQAVEQHAPPPLGRGIVNDERARRVVEPDRGDDVGRPPVLEPEHERQTRGQTLAGKARRHHERPGGDPSPSSQSMERQVAVPF